MCTIETKETVATGSFSAFIGSPFNWRSSSWQEISVVQALAGRLRCCRYLKQACGPLAAAVIDIDSFNKVNHSYGHDGGDVVGNINPRNGKYFFLRP
jgi:hypothetical protein